MAALFGQIRRRHVVRKGERIFGKTVSIFLNKDELIKAKLISKHEQPVDLQDEGLQKVFTTEEVEEMARNSAKDDLENAFPQDLNTILNNLNQKVMINNVSYV